MGTDMLKEACRTELRLLLDDWKKLLESQHADRETMDKMSARIHKLCDYLDGLEKK